MVILIFFPLQLIVSRFKKHWRFTSVDAVEDILQWFNEKQLKKKKTYYMDKKL